MRYVYIIVMSCLLFSCSPTENHPLCGNWVSGSLFLTISNNGSFILSDIVDDKQYSELSGTWREDESIVTLKVHRSESSSPCNVQEGEEIKIAYNIISNQELEIIDHQTGDTRRYKRNPQQSAAPDAQKPARP